jgi:hypothetical protein
LEQAPIVGHAHLEAIVVEASPAGARRAGPARIVLVSQPDVVGGTHRGAFFLPWQSRRVVDAVTAALEPFVTAGAVVVKYRPHPKEVGGDRLPVGISCDRGPAGVALLSRHDVFVGVTSMVLFEAALARRFTAQLDLPVLRQSVAGDWPPYAVGTRIGSVSDLTATVADLARRAKAGESGPGIEGLNLAGSLERSVALAEAFLGSSGAASGSLTGPSGAN